MHGIRVYKYPKRKSNGKITMVRTSKVHTYELRHLFASIRCFSKSGA